MIKIVNQFFQKMDGLICGNILFRFCLNQFLNPVRTGQPQTSSREIGKSPAPAFRVRICQSFDGPTELAELSVRRPIWRIWRLQASC